MRHLFQPTLPLRGATVQSAEVGSNNGVSTHAPLAGSDLFNTHPVVDVLAFQPTLPLRGATQVTHTNGVQHVVSTHAPLAGSDDCHRWLHYNRWRFNPRSPCGERHRVRRAAKAERGFNPRSPCGERLFNTHPVVNVLAVSTHAPLAGSDKTDTPTTIWGLVSTHAPLAGSDHSGCPI